MFKTVTEVSNLNTGSHKAKLFSTEVSAKECVTLSSHALTSNFMLFTSMCYIQGPLLGFVSMKLFLKFDFHSNLLSFILNKKINHKLSYNVRIFFRHKADEDLMDLLAPQKDLQAWSPRFGIIFLQSFSELIKNWQRCVYIHVYEAGLVLIKLTNSS